MRHYDVGAGQFTQPDPIGLAGGLNLYGYADGDPINFSDPFGLCPQAVKNGTYCIDLFIQARRAGPLAGDGCGHSPNAPARQSRAQILVDPASGSVSSSVSPSCIAGTSICGGPNSSNSIDGTRGDDGSFSVAFSLTNSFGGPDIDGTVTFTPNGKGGFNVSHDISAFPSNGIYQRVNGKWVKAKPDHSETTPLDLIDGRGRDKSP